MTLLPLVLPDGFTPIVKVGDKLTKGALLAEKKGSLGQESINLSEELKIQPSDITKTLKKNLADRVEVGEVLAVKSGSFGMGSKKVLSQFSGTIAKIDTDSGNVVIKTSLEGKKEQVFSPVEGKVEICNNEKIVIKTDLDAIIAEDSLGSESQGKIFYAKSLLESSLTKELDGKILLIKTIDKASVFKAIGLDAIGIITASLEDIDFVDLTEKRINIPVMEVSEDNFSKLAKHENASVYLNGKDKSLIFYEEK